MFPKSALTVVYNILIVGRVFLTPIFYEDPPYIAYPRFQILPNTLPRPPSSNPTVFFCFLVPLTEYIYKEMPTLNVWLQINMNKKTQKIY